MLIRDKLGSIGLNYPGQISDDIEQSICDLLKEYWQDINGFVAELICHLRNNPKLVDTNKISLSLKDYPLAVWYAISVYCDFNITDERRINNLELFEIKTFNLKINGEDPIFKRFKIRCAKPNFATAIHHSDKIINNRREYDFIH